MWIYIIIAIIVLIVIYALALYNSFVKLNNKVKEAFSTMDVYLKKRWDLIPNIVSTVKGYAKHEAETLEKVIAARNNGYSSLNTQQKLQANAELGTAIKSLNVVAEQYPDHCTMTDEDTETGCKEFEIEKGRLSFRLTAPYSEERRQAASKAAKTNSVNSSHNIQKICYNFFEKCNQCPSKSAYKGEGPFNTEERR